MLAIAARNASPETLLLTAVAIASSRRLRTALVERVATDGERERPAGIFDEREPGADAVEQVRDVVRRQEADMGGFSAVRGVEVVRVLRQVDLAQKRRDLLAERRERSQLLGRRQRSIGLGEKDRLIQRAARRRRIELGRLRTNLAD